MMPQAPGQTPDSETESVQQRYSSVRRGRSRVRDRDRGYCEEATDDKIGLRRDNLHPGNYLHCGTGTTYTKWT